MSGRGRTRAGDGGAAPPNDRRRKRFSLSRNFSQIGESAFVIDLDSDEFSDCETIADVLEVALGDRLVSLPAAVRE